jgi:primosomal protein N''
MSVPYVDQSSDLSWASRTPPDRMTQTLNALYAQVQQLSRQCEKTRRDAQADGCPERHRDALHLQARLQALHQCVQDVERVLDRLNDRP